jgi:hypothetical protein
VFSFIISLVEVNARLSHGYFNDELPLPQVIFWKQLARELIEYSEKGVGAVRRRKQDLQEVEEVLCYQEQLHCMLEHGQAQNEHICILSILSTSVGHLIAKNESGPTVAATYSTGSAEYALANTLRGKKSTNEITTKLVILFFRPNTLCN